MVVSELYIGLMSGTSLDGVDAVLVDFSGTQPQVVGHCSAPLTSALKSELLSLNSSGTDELHRAALAANALAQGYANLVSRLLSDTGIAAKAVCALGAHGQTVRHRPSEFDGVGYTLQLNQPALLAELCGIAVVADFRSRDVAAGGQGAPLVPPFHHMFFSRPGQRIAVLNVGGISNVTLLDGLAHTPLQGFDCGPGNALMDAWTLEYTGAEFDDAGRWAAGGRVHEALLDRLLSEPFFRKPPPKSTGRDLFNRQWLAPHLDGLAVAPQDVQTTLAELTALSCRNALQSAMPGCEAVIVCGGGALNLHLMSRLQFWMPSCAVTSSDACGMPAQQVEATAFAWLARQAMLGKTGSVQSVTGARGARILGAIYPG
jgi:anhydro-N-acetylmuramic acid kinase